MISAIAAPEISPVTVVSGVGIRNSRSLPPADFSPTSLQEGRSTVAGMPPNGSVSTVATARMTRSSCGSGRSKTETNVPQ